MSTRPLPTIGIVSLGCPKALVDSERILTRLRAEGYAITPSYDKADAVIVNTCGFLDSARAESLEAIGEAMNENGRVIVTGCMGVDATTIRRIFPGVLAITGPHQYEAVVQAVHDAVPPDANPLTSLVPPQGIRLTPRHYAYLKISEGCDHACAFCIIPQLRGPQVSRPAAKILAEAEAPADAGAQELLVIAQDTSAYGQDIGHAASTWRGRPVRAHIVDLAEALGELGIWIRLHYVYPTREADDLMPLIVDGAILPYLDMPFQHASASVLKAMRRPGNHDRLLDRIHHWRNQVPNLALRSTFIVGFPGETDTDFETLLDFLKRAELDRVGCFKYENVAGAPANSLDNHIPEDIKEQRWHRFMQTQQDVSARRMAAKVGTRIDVIIDEVDDEGAIGRSYADAPDIDGAVFLNGDTDVAVGDIVEIEVEHAEDYDLWGTRPED
ncbi:MAG: 30S ribosomal protein S12 methylthiotransferase RimO [Rhodospirillaceae bacterium]|nr:30S ribosomal protein S12 methylthiotransferase RimO [Rhodospirillaceae bacterium]